ncbi:MAG TPA: selenium metabolism-associated LysR family transcriptional regulator [Geopsychrobacteraceae bacterium]|nr:selenium metabolism-associated LysR family transcriptional regulator [Geopsychrobacteraceae bacterium]
MDMKRLDFFCQVLELKSFTRAAEKLHLTQPTVSEGVRLLEETLGETLLDRMGREVLPTPAGKILYRYAKRILQLRDEAKKAVIDLRDSAGSLLSLGASTIPGAYLLPHLIETYSNQNPGAEITLKISGTGQILDDLSQERLELALVGGMSMARGLDWHACFGDELVLIVPPTHRWAGRETIEPVTLLDEPMLLREAGSGTRTTLEQHLRQNRIEPAKLRVLAEMGSNEAVKQGVRGGLGVAVISGLSVADEVSRGDLIALKLAGEPLSRPFYLVQRSGRQLSSAAESFRRLVLASS